MSRPSAKQIVNKLLEYGINPDMPPAGHPDDPWRQSTGPLPPMEFGGRPGPADEPEETPFSQHDPAKLEAFKARIDRGELPEMAPEFNDLYEKLTSGTIGMTEYRKLLALLDMLDMARPPKSTAPSAPPLGRHGGRMQWRPPATESNARRMLKRMVNG